MSYKVGIDTLKLQPTERLAHTEYCSNDALKRAVTGFESTDPRIGSEFHEAWQYDFIWSVNDGPTGWSQPGRTTDMGHAEFMEGGVDRRDTVCCPFKDVEEVYAFDAVEEYGLPEMDDLITYLERAYQNGQTANPNQVFTGGYYKTIVSGAIQTFGWDMLLEAAADQKRFEKVLDSFFQLTLQYAKAWSKTSIEAYIQHDDMVWTQGAFVHPDFYRSVIFPRYKKLWEPLLEAGKIVLFCSDGDFTEFIDDIAAAGAQGFIFEPMTSLDYAVERYGKTHAIVSSKVDCRTLTFGTPDKIRHEIDETLKLAFDCPGFMFAVGNHIPSNVPVDNALYYFDHLSRNWRR